MSWNWHRAVVQIPSALCAAWLGAGSALAQPAPATEADLKTCVELHVNAQIDMRRSELLLARSKLDRCSSPGCPALIRDDCAGLRRELLPRIPSIVPSATDAHGRKLDEVAVWIDGVKMLERLDGSALDLNPGEHELKFETPAGAVLERRIRVEEREKSQPVVMTFRQAADTKPISAVKPGEGAVLERSEPIPKTAYVLGGISALAFVSFGVFAVSGLSGKADLEDCRPRCAKDEVSAVRNQFLVADLSLAVGVLAGAGAAYLVVGPRAASSTERSRPAQPLAIGIIAKANGAHAELAWTF